MREGTVQPDGIRIRQLRISAGLTQQSLADRIGCSKGTVENLEHGKPVFVHSVSEAAQALGVVVTDIIYGADNAAISPATLAVEKNESDVIRSAVCLFDTFINEHSQGFVGRHFLRRKVDDFLGGGNNPSGYMFIQGEPGIGKSAFLATLIRERGYRVYHFNRAVQGIKTAGQFLRNICARIIIEFGLRYDSFPDGAFESGEFLEKVLSEAGTALKGDAVLVILIDALDEVDRSSLAPRSNLLFLPESLPDRVYVIATTRPLTDLPLRVSYSLPPFVLDASSPENRQDAREYIEAFIDDGGIDSWMHQQSLTRKQCISLLLDKSEANFMYLRHVLPAIAKGWLKELTWQELPPGLDSYYREHWRHMRSINSAEFDQLHKPVICVLAALEEAEHLKGIARYATESIVPLDLTQVKRALGDLREYLDVRPVAIAEAAQAETEPGDLLYRLYHNQFREFLASGEVDFQLKEARERIWNAIERNWDAVKE